MIARSSVHLLFSLLVIAGSIQASDDANHWLKRMVNAARNFNYTGTLVYTHDGIVDSMKIVHSSGPDGIREKMYSLNGEVREVLRDNNKVTCFMPKSRSVMVGDASENSVLPLKFPINPEQLEGFYAIELGEEGRVAGFVVRLLTITPKDSLRYGYQLWLDKDTGMMLKSNMLDEKGKSLEQFMFTELELNADISAEQFKPSIETEGYTWQVADVKYPVTSEQQVTWEARNRPAGFMLASASTRNNTQSGRSVAHLLYSDGLSNVSVYIEPYEQGQDVLQGGSRMGAVHAFGVLVDGYGITAIGETPLKTVEMIARSMTRTAGPMTQ